jgi:hypothetical protein
LGDEGLDRNLEHRRLLGGLRAKAIAELRRTESRFVDALPLIKAEVDARNRRN